MLIIVFINDMRETKSLLVGVCVCFLNIVRQVQSNSSKR